MTVDSQMSWGPHIRGENWRAKGDNEPGLISRLVTRVTATRRLMWVMAPAQLRTYIEGTVNAVLQYCLAVYCNAWGEGGGGSKSLCTKDDQRRLQVLQNKALRCLVRGTEKIPWQVLAHMGAEEHARKTGILTVNQMTAMAILTTTHRILGTKKPVVIYERMRISGTRLMTMSIKRPTVHQLKLTSEGFVEKAMGMWNRIPIELRKEQSVTSFKARIKSWVKGNWPAKPP